MKTDFGLFIRETAIKNLLSAQGLIAEKGNVLGLITLTKFILKISHKFDDYLLDLGLEESNKCADDPPNKSEEYVPKFES